MLDVLTARPTLTLGLTLIGAIALAQAVRALTISLARLSHRPHLRAAQDRCGRPFLATLVACGELIAVPHAGLPAEVTGPVRHALVLATIASVSWLIGQVLFLIEDGALNRVRIDVRDNRRARRMRTQITVIRRLTAVVVTVIALAAMLMTFDAMRTYGASVLASAGIVGVVAGLAAQTTLSNLFAGLQLVFTDALRFDDVVVVEDQWGRIEELTLTYVVVHLWDERRLVLPATYFTTTPFENWTRSESRVLAAVELYLDPSAPVDSIRTRARELVEANPLWDRREWVLQVTGMTETAMVVRLLASAADSSSAWDLRCDLREQLLAWIRIEHPDALTRVRVSRGPSDAVNAWGTLHRQLS